MYGSVHESDPAQLPAVVAHPLTVSHVAEQHTFDGPTAHVVDVAVQAHVVHPPPPSQ